MSQCGLFYYGGMALDDQTRLGIGRAIGRVPSGLYILTAEHGGRADGMLVSWVQQAAFEPAAVSVAIAKGRSVGQMVKESGRLAISVLGKSDVALMRRFARTRPDEEDPFAGLKLLRTVDGGPVLADALAYLDCRLLTVCEFGGDHEVIIAQVVGGNILKDGDAFTHQRGNGFHY